MAKQNFSEPDKVKCNYKIQIIGDGNAFEIINAIRRLNLNGSEVFKAQIADVTGYSIPTISRALDNNGEGLISKKVIIESSNNSYNLDAKFAYFMGIHLGVSKIRVAICNLSLEPLSENELKEFGLGKYKFNDEKCWDEYMDYVSSNRDNYREPTIYEIRKKVNGIINDVLSEVEKKSLPLVSICIASPSIYNLETTEIKHCPGLESLINAKLKGLLFDDTKKRLRYLGILYGFEHNTEAVLLYEREQLYKTEKNSNNPFNYNNVAVVYIGTGIGVALIVNGHLYRGKLGASGELGHLRAPLLPDFDEGREDLLSNDKLNRDSSDEKEDNLSFNDVNRYLKPYLTLEDAIRYRVFNCKPDDTKLYMKRTEKDALINFKSDHPMRYELLKQYTSYITNVLIDLLSMDIIIYGGSIFYWTKGLIEDLSNKQGEDAIMCLADETKIMLSSDYRDDIVAIGAAYAAYFRCEEKNRMENSIDMPIRVKWKPLGERANEN